MNTQATNKALIRLRVAHTTLLEISCHGSNLPYPCHAQALLSTENFYEQIGHKSGPTEHLSRP